MNEYHLKIYSIDCLFLGSANAHVSKAGKALKPRKFMRNVLNSKTR